MRTELELDGEELCALARLDLQQNRIEDCLIKLKQAISQKNCPVEARLDVARVYGQLGLRKKAQIHFNSYLEQRPDDVDARFQFGMTFFEENQIDAALPLWEQVLQRSPKYPPALFYRALAVAKAGKAADARKQLDALMQTLPPDNLYFSRARDLLKELESAPQAGRIVSAAKREAEH